MNDRVSMPLSIPSQPQLPVNAYFSEEVFQYEKESIFKHASLYVGNEKSVQNVGDWHRLAHDDGARVLVRNERGVELISNVCRHRQALILGGNTGNVTGASNNSGNLAVTGGNIVCPLHRWTYDLQGQLLGAPHFEDKPCRNLERFGVENCHGFLYEGNRDPAQDMALLFARPEFDFSEYLLDHVEVHTCRYNWKTFVEVYLEDYHVEPFHPGLGNFVTCDDLNWEFTDTYSLQRLNVHQALAQPGSSIYRKWHDRLLNYRNGVPPEFGAIWVTYFPTHMIELYPHVLVVSTLYPKSPRETLNVIEFYYPEAIAAFEREFIEAHRAAYLETMIEDDEIAERMDAGRLALHRREVSDVGPYQSPMESGMLHFHAWYGKDHDRVDERNQLILDRRGQPCKRAALVEMSQGNK